MENVQKIFKKIGKWIKKHKKLTIFLLIILVLGIMLTNYVKTQQARMAELLNQVQETAIIERRDMLSYISTTGVIESDENKDITSTLTGYKVNQVLVEVGDEVRVGDTILLFNTEDLEKDIENTNTDIANAIRQNEITMAQVQRDYKNTLESTKEQNDSNSKDLASALEDVEDARKEVAILEEELSVSTQYLASKQTELDAIKAEYDTKKIDYDNRKSTLSAIQASFDIANSDLNIAKTELADYKLLNPDEFEELTGALSPIATTRAEKLTDTVEKRQSDLNTYSIQLENAKIALNSISADYNEILTAYNTRNTAYQEALTAWQTTNSALMNKRTALEAAEKTYDRTLISENSALRTGNSSVLKIQESMENQEISMSSSMRTLDSRLDTYLENLEKAAVTTPIKGVVTAVNVEDGNTYSGGTLITVQDCDTFIIATQIDEYDISTLEKGMKVVIKTDATRDDELEGEITFIAPTPTKSTTSASVTYRVEITVKTKDDRLRLGMTAKTNIILEQITQALSVPYDAVQTNADGETILMLQETDELGNVLEREVKVRVGREGDYYVEVLCEEDIEGKTVIVPAADGDPMADMMRMMMGQ